MICPDCKAENIEGADLCESCGADLRNLKLPGAQTQFEEHLINDRLGGIVAGEAATVSPGDPVAYAVHFMREKETEAVLVADDDEVIGILTERDILLKASGEKVDLNAMAVRDIMTPDPVILREDDTLAVALHKMSIGGFRHIPFVAEGRPVQMVSISDVFRHVSSVVHLAGTTL